MKPHADNDRDEGGRGAQRQQDRLGGQRQEGGKDCADDEILSNLTRKRRAVCFTQAFLNLYIVSSIPFSSATALLLLACP